MKYESKKFNFGLGATQEYRDNWESVFGKKDVPSDTAACTVCPATEAHEHHQMCWRCNKYLAVPAGTAAFANTILCSDCHKALELPFGPAD